MQPRRGCLPARVGQRLRRSIAARCRERYRDGSFLTMMTGLPHHHRMSPTCGAMRCGRGRPRGRFYVRLGHQPHRGAALHDSVTVQHRCWLLAMRFGRGGPRPYGTRPVEPLHAAACNFVCACRLRGVGWVPTWPSAAPGCGST